MKRLFIKVLTFTIATVTLLSTLLLPATAAVAPIINPMLDTYVVDDLVTMNYNPDNYPKDPSATHLQLIHFMEYGYSSTDNRYYGLYIYLYNPCGKEIELEGSYLQMSYDSGSTDYSKYPCTVVSYSVDEGNKYVFYKLKVNGINDVWRNINSSSRVYNLANLEILYKGQTKVTTKSWEENGKNERKNVWTYQGYQKGFGSNTEVGTLSFTVNELDTIPVEMHDASWFSDTSSLGEDYRWEVKSYYFNIPYSYIMKYGDPLNVQSTTQGLYAVQGEYYKYGLNGWIRNVSTTNSFYVGMNESTSGLIHNVNYDISYNMTLKDEYFEHITSDFVIKKLCLDINGDSPDISNETLMNLWKLSNKPVISSSNNLYIGSKTSDIGERVPFDVSVDSEDLSSAIETYGSKQSTVANWLGKTFKLKMYTDADGYKNCAPLVQITDLKEYTQANYVGKELYLDYESYQDLCDFYKEMTPELANGFQASNVYLMRVSVEPYYCVEANNGYYFEKVIHKNTDIFSFTFKNSSGGKVTVPVDCDPVDNIGSVVAGSNKDDSNPNGYPDDPSAGEIGLGLLKDLGDFLKSLKGWIVLLGICLGTVTVTVLVVVFWKYLEPWFRRAGNLLGKLGRGLGSVFGFLFRLIFNIFKAIWNIGFTVLFYFTGLDLRIKGGLDLGSGMTQKRDRYEKEDHEWEREKRQFLRNDEERTAASHDISAREREQGISIRDSEERRNVERHDWARNEEGRKDDRHDWARSDEIRKGVRLGWEHNEEIRRQQIHDSKFKP